MSQQPIMTTKVHIDDEGVYTEAERFVTPTWYDVIVETAAASLHGETDPMSVDLINIVTGHGTATGDNTAALETMVELGALTELGNGLYETDRARLDDFQRTVADNAARRR